MYLWVPEKNLFFDSQPKNKKTYIHTYIIHTYKHTLPRGEREKHGKIYIYKTQNKNMAKKKRIYPTNKKHTISSLHMHPIIPENYAKKKKTRQ